MAGFGKMSFKGSGPKNRSLSLKGVNYTLMVVAGLDVKMDFTFSHTITHFVSRLPYMSISGSSPGGSSNIRGKVFSSHQSNLGDILLVPYVPSLRKQ